MKMSQFNKYDEWSPQGSTQKGKMVLQFPTWTELFKNQSAIPSIWLNLFNWQLDMMVILHWQRLLASLADIHKSWSFVGLATFPLERCWMTSTTSIIG